MAFNIKELQRKPKLEESIGARIDTDTKRKLDKFCNVQGISINALITALIKDLLTTNGY